MKPKEKAEELVWKYSRALQLWDEENSLKAIQCALIAVDECLNTCVENMIYYWQEVKQEVENM